jgi:hypothetical protein
VCVAAVATSCTRGDDLTAPTLPTTPIASATPSSPGGSTEVSGSGDAGTVTTGDGATGDDTTGDDTAPVSLVTTPPISVVDVPEVGVPGLDSDDAFCSSWSRFAGSFQVVAVTAAFGSGPPEELAALEVAAAPTVTSAYRDLLENWPDELADEADLVADDFLGPFARRLAAARTALGDVGADDDAVASIEAAWLDGLAQRDPSTPEFVVDLPDELWRVIDDAASAFAQQRVPFSQDPSLVTDVQTPKTIEYLAVTCPDQGTLSGQEVETP